jgi:hypothetical protein
VMRRKKLAIAKQFPGRDPGAMDGTGGTRKVTIHTEGVLRGKHGKDGNAYWLADYVADANIGYHFTYDYSGRFGQLYHPKQGSRSLVAGRWSPNRQGAVNIQVCFVGVKDAADVREWPMHNWEKFLKYCDSWGVPRKPITNFRHPTRSEWNWRRSGWTCHAAAPFSDHVDGAGAPISWLLSLDQRRR